MKCLSSDAPVAAVGPRPTLIGYVLGPRFLIVIGLITCEQYKTSSLPTDRTSLSAHAMAHGKKPSPHL